MIKHWYEDEKKVIELAEFLVQSVELESTEELLEYFKHPEMYTEVWNIYEKGMLGIKPISLELSKKPELQEPRGHRTHTAPSCACGIV